MRGENVLHYFLTGLGGGPSPHARGKHSPGRTAWTWTRSIPACAGKTLAFLPPAVPAAVHPRMRGENGGDRDYGQRAQVHPRMRGENVRNEVGVNDVNGPSPHARGKQPYPRPNGGGDKVHPRMRGENDDTEPGAAGQKGPSPHARGKQTLYPPHSSTQRSIPACAGKTPR